MVLVINVNDELGIAPKIPSEDSPFKYQCFSQKDGHPDSAFALTQTIKNCQWYIMLSSVMIVWQPYRIKGVDLILGSLVKILQSMSQVTFWYQKGALILVVIFAKIIPYPRVFQIIAYTHFGRSEVPRLLEPYITLSYQV